MKLDPKKAREHIKRLTKGYTFKHSAPAKKNVRLADGTVNQTYAQYVEAVLAAHARTFSNKKAPIDTSILDPIPDYPILWDTNDQISIDELLLRLPNLPNNKAPGDNDVTTDALKALAAGVSNENINTHCARPIKIMFYLLNKI